MKSNLFDGFVKIQRVWVPWKQHGITSHSFDIFAAVGLISCQPLRTHKAATPVVFLTVFQELGRFFKLLPVFYEATSW